MAVFLLLPLNEDHLFELKEKLYCIAGLLSAACDIRVLSHLQVRDLINFSSDLALPMDNRQGGRLIPFSFFFFSSVEEEQKNREKWGRKERCNKTYFHVVVFKESQNTFLPSSSAKPRSVSKAPAHSNGREYCGSYLSPIDL